MKRIYFVICVLLLAAGCRCNSHGGAQEVTCQCFCDDFHVDEPEKNNDSEEEKDLFRFVTDAALRDSLNHFVTLSGLLYEVDELMKVAISIEKDPKEKVTIVRGYNFPAFVHPFSKVAGESVEPYEVVVFYDSPSWIDVSMLSEDEAYRLLGKDLICIIQEQPEALSIEETFIKGENGEWRSMGISARSWIKRKSL